jgi:hypothetical protein
MVSYSSIVKLGAVGMPEMVDSSSYWKSTKISACRARNIGVNYHFS